jgi:CrcB protein
MESLTKILAVALGGAFGATARYLVSVSPLHSLFEKFPFHTFLVNVIGSFLLGFCLILFTEKFTVSETLKLFVMVGFLGALTTFSTFELEIWSLLKNSYYGQAFLYLFLSVLAGFTGVILGIWLGRKF